MLRKAFLQEVFLALSQGRCQTLAGRSRNALPILESWMECTSLGPHLDLMPLESRAHYARCQVPGASHRTASVSILLKLKGLE